MQENLYKYLTIFLLLVGITILSLLVYDMLTPDPDVKNRIGNEGQIDRAYIKT